MSRNALMIGATGLLGHSATNELSKEGWHVRAIGREELVYPRLFEKEVEYISGDFYDDTFLTSVLKDIDKVFFFLSSTFPSTSTDSLELEITRTLRGLDCLLRKMRELGVKEMVYPSSGGTLYGNVETGTAKETDALKPTTPYGVGKMLCEDVIRYYSAFGIYTTILRIGNVYGSPVIRKMNQGVIDIFVQKALTGEPAIVWGDSLHNIRDYIFVDDFSNAVAHIADLHADGIEIYNLSSGEGTRLEEIVRIINANSPSPLQVRSISGDATSPIKRIVLDMDKFEERTGWKARFDIERGIVETISRKKHVMEG